MAAGAGCVGPGWQRSDTNCQLPEMRADGNRIEYRRDGIVEWYRNDSRGLEQGFTISRDPGGRSTSDRLETPPPLRLDLSVGKDLSMVLADDRGTVDFIAPGGARVIRYDHLQVVDACNQAIPAWFEILDHPQRVSIVVDDRDASYPLTIDPWRPARRGREGNQSSAGSRFRLHAGDVNGDGFSDVIVGAYNFDNGQADEGRAFVYHGSASGLSLTPNWTAESDQAGAQFAIPSRPRGMSMVTATATSSWAWRMTSPSWRITARQADSPVANWTEVVYGFNHIVAAAGDVNGDGFGDVLVGHRMSTSRKDGCSVPTARPAGLATAFSWGYVGGLDPQRLGASVAAAGRCER